MNFNDLETFSVIYKSHSFSEAATKLYMSPQGLAKVISRLENSLSVTLFDRSTKGIVPTKHADRLYVKTQELQNIMREISVIGTEQYLSKKTISVYSTYGFWQYLGLDFLLSFQTQYPHILVNAVEFPDSALSNAFETQKAHIGFVTGPIDTTKYRGLYLKTDRYKLLLPSGSPLAKKEKITMEDLLTIPIAVKGQDHNIYDVNLNRFIKSGGLPDIAIECSDDFIRLEYVKRGLGAITVIDYQIQNPAFQQCLKDGSIVIRDIQEDCFARDVYFVEILAEELSAEEQIFRDFVFRNRDVITNNNGMTYKNS